MAALHLPHVISRVGTDAISVTDADPDLAWRMAETHGLKASYVDLETMLARHRPEVVFLLTPPSTHAALSIRAMRAGCHVLVEKPMAMNAREAMSMVEMAMRRDRKLCVNHNFRWNPRVAAALDYLEKGRAGHVLSVDVRFSFDPRRAAVRGVHGGDALPSWLRDQAGGLLFDAFPHPASILLEVTGEPNRVFSTMRCNGVLGDGNPDELFVLVEGAEALGSLSISLGSRPDCLTATFHASGMTVHVNGTNMTLAIRRHRTLPPPIRRLVDSLEHAAGLLCSTVSGGCAMATRRMGPPGDVGPVVNAFYDSIEKGLRPPAPGYRAVAVMRLADEIWKASPDNTVVNIR